MLTVNILLKGNRNEEPFSVLSGKGEVSARQPSLKRRNSETNIETVLKATLRKLLRDGVVHIAYIGFFLSPPSAQMNSAELN